MKYSYKLLVISYKFSLVIVSALCLILSFPNFNLSFLAWVALVPLFFALENKTPLRAFLIAYLAGVIFFLGTIWWLIHVTLPGMLLVVMYLAFYFGLFGFITGYGLRVTGYSSLLILPTSWVTLEWIRSTGRFGFGWALLGHSQSFMLPVIQIADITGAYGVSFLIVLVNVAIFLAVKNFKEKRDFSIPVGIASLILFAALAYGYFRLNQTFTGEKIKVAVIQGNIPQDEKWDMRFRDEIMSKYETLTKDASKEKQDFVIWPETSIPGYLETDRELLERLKGLAKDIRTPIFVGAPREDEERNDRIYNSAVLISEDGRIVDHYDKLHLVPFGEYIPFKNLFSFVEKFAPRPIGDFQKGERYTVFNFFIERGSRAKDFNWRLVKKVSFSSLVCFEDIFPELSREFVKMGADFIVNITNDAWFWKSSAPYQHAQGSVFRAVENRVNVVRAANTGYSCFIDQKGRILAAVESKGEKLFVDGFKSCDIVLSETKTLYTTYGDIFAYICILLALSNLVRIVRLAP